MLIDIIPATREDEDCVFQFLQKYFYPDEPLTMALKKPPPDDQKTCSALELLDENLSFMALEKDNPSQLCGILLNRVLTKNAIEDECNSRNDDIDDETPKGKIVKFWNHVKLKTNEAMISLWNETNTETALDACMVAVRTNCRGQQIGLQLFEKTIRLAKEKQIKWITICCTSAYTAVWAEKLGFTEIFSLPYKDYINDKGEIVFNVEKPHEAYRAFAKYSV